MKLLALTLLIFHCFVAGGCMNDRLMEKMIGGAEFVPTEPEVVEEEVEWESYRLLVQVLPRARASIEELAPPSMHGDWEVYAFEEYFYGRNLRKPGEEFLAPNFQEDGDTVILKGGSAYVADSKTWIITAPETVGTLREGKFHFDGKVRIVKGLGLNGS